jgi:hypothetical protein
VFTSGLVLITLLSVAMMFVCPGVDLPLTALRAWHQAMLAHVGVVLAATVLAGFALRRASSAAFQQFEPLPMASRERLDFLCSLLC